jgi:hypothetical protein
MAPVPRGLSNTLLRLFVLGRYPLERDDKVFQRSLLLAALDGLAMHQIVESNAILEKIVDTSHDAEDAEAENPDTNYSDDARNPTLERAPEHE